MMIPCEYGLMLNERVRPARRRAPLHAVTTFALSACLMCALSASTFADRLRLTDGTVIVVDAIWEDAQGVWYLQDGVTRLIEQEQVSAIEDEQCVNEESVDESPATDDTPAAAAAAEEEEAVAVRDDPQTEEPEPALTQGVRI